VSRRAEEHSSRWFFRFLRGSLYINFGRALGHHDGNGSLDFHTGGKSQKEIRNGRLRQLPDLSEQFLPRD
jgi:hypothetical protein